MRYSNEFKMKCVEMYYNGQYPDTPSGITSGRFHKTVRKWVRLFENGGTDALFHRITNKRWTPEERYNLVAKVIASESCKSVAISAGINEGQLYQWVSKYKIKGYNGLIFSKGRPSAIKKKTNLTPRPLTESEHEELIRLRAENEYIKAENEVIKKQIALRHEKWAAELKAKKQQSSKNSEKEDIN